MDCFLLRIRLASQFSVQAGVWDQFYFYKFAAIQFGQSTKHRHIFRRERPTDRNPDRLQGGFCVPGLSSEIYQPCLAARPSIEQGSKEHRLCASRLPSDTLKNFTQTEGVDPLWNTVFT